MNKRLFYSSTIIMIFLMSNSASGAINASFAVGDSFTFTISKLSISSKVNGTEYAPAIDSGLEKTNTYTVTAMNSTVVTLSYPSNGVNKTMYVVIDSFSQYFLLIFAGVLGFYFASPGYVNFSAPTITVSQSDDLSTGFFPMFASGNVTYYHTLINTSATTDSNPLTSDGYFTYTTDALSATNNQSNNVYTLAYDIGLTKSNASQQFTYSFRNTFKAVIDLTRNILTELSVYFTMNIKQGSASLNTNIEMTVVEGKGNSSNSPGFEFISFFTLMTVASILAIIYKRKR